METFFKKEKIVKNGEFPLFFGFGVVNSHELYSLSFTFDYMNFTAFGKFGVDVIAFKNLEVLS